MGLFDQLGEKLGSALGDTAGESPLLKGVLEMLSQSESGGLASLVQAFKEKGLGEIVSSWISIGENLPISAEQMRQGISRQQLQELAAKTGLSLESVGTQLAALLPVVVDKLTPNGVIPEAGLIEQGLSFLKSKLGK